MATTACSTGSTRDRRTPSPTTTCSSAGPGNDYLAPGRGDDITRGGTGRDRIEDLWGVADLRGGPGDDELSAALVLGEGDQSISGDGGTDHLLLAVDRDGRWCAGRTDGWSSAAGSPSHGSAGLVARGEVRRLESLAVPEGVWRVRGTSRADTVFGPYLGRSRLVAKLRGGADRVFGGPGSDLLVGGAGRDFARPGGGFDTCRFDRDHAERRSLRDRLTVAPAHAAGRSGTSSPHERRPR